MPIPGVEQPEILPVSDGLRLRKYDGKYYFALPWYQDPETVYLVDGVRAPYTLERLEQMYTYLDSHGELYFIELREGESWRPIGDITFWQTDMPIVIGDPACRGRGIGKQVAGVLVERGRKLGYPTLWIGEIYRWNTASRRCFEALGFKPCEKTENGDRYRLDFPGK